jgi:hypothetical protein
MFFLPVVLSLVLFIYVIRQEKLQGNILCLLMLLHHLVFLPFFLIRHAPVGSLLFPLLLIWCGSFLGYALWLDYECHREHNTLTLKKRIFLFISPLIEWGIWCCFAAAAWESTMGMQYNTKLGILFYACVHLLGTILLIFPLFCTYLFWTIIRVEGWKHNGLCLLAIIGQFLCFSLFLRSSYIPIPIIIWYLAVVFYTFWLEYQHQKTFRSKLVNTVAEE